MTDRSVGRRSHGRFLKGCLVTALVAVLLCVGIGLFGVWKIGPRYGIYLLPPSPQQYADDALTAMDQGLYASGERWRQARATAHEKTRDASSYAETLPALREALAVAGGKHSRLFDSGQSLESTTTDRELPTVEVAGGVATVRLPRLMTTEESFRRQYATTLAEGISSADASACGWVVDLRGNRGGDMLPMLAGLYPLLDDGTIGGWQTRDGHRTDVTATAGRIQAGQESMAAPVTRRIGEPVAVLQDDETASSGEVVLLAFRGSDRARSFGQGSAGYSTSNQVKSLYDDTQMLLTTGVDVDRSGRAYGGVVEAETPAGTKQAPAAAARWVRGRCG